MKKQLAKDIFIFAGITVVILILTFRSDPVPSVYKVSPISKIEKVIQGKETVVREYLTKANDEKKIVAAMDEKLQFIWDQLELVKSSNDTVTMVQIQDTAIHYLVSQNTHLKSVVSSLDSVVIAQRYIINSKDTIIAIQAADVKRIKRQRNWSLFVNALQTAFIVFKK